MISKEEVSHIAKLARLELTAQEMEKMQKDLSSILDYADSLKKADTSSVKKTSDMLVENNVRKDEVTEAPASVANNLVQAAPDKKDGYIKVKQVF